MFYFFLRPKFTTYDFLFFPFFLSILLPFSVRWLGGLVEFSETVGELHHSRRLVNLCGTWQTWCPAAIDCMQQRSAQNIRSVFCVYKRTRALRHTLIPGPTRGFVKYVNLSRFPINLCRFEQKVINFSHPPRSKRHLFFCLCRESFRSVIGPFRATVARGHGCCRDARAKGTKWTASDRKML